MSKMAKETAALLTQLRVGDRVRLTEKALTQACQMTPHDMWFGLRAHNIIAQRGEIGVVDMIWSGRLNDFASIVWPIDQFFLPVEAFELVDE